MTESRKALVASWVTVACVAIVFGLLPRPGLAQSLSSQQVAASADDAEQTGATVEVGESPHEIGFDRYSGYRFAGLSIPANATIVSASIQFTAASANIIGSPRVRIVGQAADNAPQFAGSDNDITNRPTTTASVNWNIPAWPTAGESGLAQKTPDLAAIVQEIVDRPGWTSSSPLVVILEPNGGDDTRSTDSYDGSPANAAILEVVVFRLSGRSRNDDQRNSRRITSGLCHLGQ